MNNPVKLVSYTLRRVDPVLWRRVRIRAVSEGRTLRFVLLELLRVYANHGFTVVETFNATKEP